MRALVLIMVAACNYDAGDGTGDPGSSDQPDAGTTRTPDASMSGGGTFMCRTKVASVGSGNHNAGMDCQGVCHNHGFTLSGTVFSSAGGGVAVVGASITVKDASGKTFDMVTQQNGNFYTKTPVQFPITVIASSCPDVQKMPTSITSAGGCNRNGCHQIGAEGHIHLP